MPFPFMRNRAVQLQFVKTEGKSKAKESETASEPTEAIFVGPAVAAAYSEVAKDFITHAALTIGGVFAACKIIERICR